MPPWPAGASATLRAAAGDEAASRTSPQPAGGSPAPFRPRHVPSCTATMPSLRSEPVYAARPTRYTPLLRGETAADWRGTFRKEWRKCNGKYVFNKPRAIELHEARLQEDYDIWLEWREKFGVGMLLNDTSSNRHIIFTALQVSVLIRVRSSVLSARFPSPTHAHPRRGSPRRRSPRTRGSKSSTRS